MVNFVALGYLLLTIVIVGSFGFIAWDQLADAMKWPRPTYGAALGATYLAFLANFLCNNKIIFGRVSEDSANGEQETPTPGSNSSGT